MAFGIGTLNNAQLDYAVLALWNGPNTSPIYWGLRSGDLRNKPDFKFVPRVVIV
jgi:hypothetical protein